MQPLVPADSVCLADKVIVPEGMRTTSNFLTKVFCLATKEREQYEAVDAFGGFRANRDYPAGG